MVLIKKRVLSSLLCMALLFSLTACGKPATAELDELQKENEALQQQLTALEESYQVLSEENVLLHKRNVELESNQSTQSTTSSNDAKDANPIDAFFASIASGNSTAEMNLIANNWADAWEQEAYHVADWLKNQLILSEDKALVDTYITAAAEQSNRLATMALYPIADLEVPQEERIMHSGTLRGVMLAESRQQLWRDTFYQLLYVAPEYNESVVNGSYVFLFDADAMQSKIEDARSDF